MQTRRLDNNDDMTFGHGLGNILQGSAAIAQMVKNRLLMVQGDWFLDRTYGVPYFADSFLRPQNMPIITSILKAAILSVLGVLSIIEFDTQFTREKRRLSVNSSLVLNTGEVIAFNENV